MSALRLNSNRHAQVASLRNHPQDPMTLAISSTVVLSVHELTLVYFNHPAWSTHLYWMIDQVLATNVLKEILPLDHNFLRYSCLTTHIYPLEL